MENIEGGFSQPAIVNEKEKEEEKEKESGAPVNRQSDGKTDSPAHRHHPSDVIIHREEPGCRCGRDDDAWSCDAGETDDHCPPVVGCTTTTSASIIPCARIITASEGAKMLDIVNGSGGGDVVSDGICGDCSSGNAPGGTATDGPSVPCSSTGDGIDGGDAHDDSQSFLSNADRTELPNKHSCTADAVTAICPTIGSETHPGHGLECSEGTRRLNVGCLVADLGTQTCHCTGTVGMETKLVNGGFISGESSSSSGTRHTNPTSPLPPGGEVVGCLSHSRSEKPSSSMGADSIHSQGSPPQATTGEEPHSGAVNAHCRAQRNATEPRPDGTRCSSELASRGVRNPNSEPGRAPVSPSIPEDDTEAEEALSLSNLGLSYTPTSGPRSLPCSVSYDSAPLSPGSRLEEAGSDEAFGDVQQQCDQRFMDVNLGSRNTYECSNRRQSAPGHLPQGGPFRAGETADSKRPGSITEYFGRGLFSRKQRVASQSAPGWKLFGKIPLRESPTKDSKTIKQESGPGGLTSLSTPDLLNSGEYESRQGRTTDGNSPPTQHALGRSRKNLEFEPLSTTALILEDRPANLPAKSVEEAQRHRQLYDEMVAGAKKRELKEAQKKQKQMKDRFKQEEIISNAMVTWNNDILPHWDTMKSSRRARELWWQGLPPNVRGRVWSLAIGNELNITSELYGIFLSRAKEKWRSFSETGSECEADDGASQADRESSLELIKLDISRTFPSLFIFQKGGPYHDLLHSVLGAYTCYRPDVGYVQGMSFIAAVLILNLEEADAFISFANLLNKPCQMAFFRVDHELMLKYFAAFEVFFEENLPRLFKHFQTSNLTPDLYLIDWIFSLYTKSLPLDVACRVWDVFCRDGEEFLFRTGLGILRLCEDVLLQMDFIHIAQFLARLPDEELLSDRLFSCIAATPMVSGNRKWSQVFNSLIKDNREADKMTSPSLKS